MASNPVRRMRTAPPPPRRSGTHVEGHTEVTHQMTVSREVRDSGSREGRTPSRVFPDGLHPANVSVGVGMTIATAPFESLRIDIRVSLPCLPEEVDETYEQASTMAADFMAREQSNWLGK